MEHIKNDKSIFNRALVVCHTEAAEELWFFSPELQLFEPEDITDQHVKAMSKWLRSNLDPIVNFNPATADRLFNRYQRIGEELLSAMKYLDLEAALHFFRLTDVLASLKAKTEKLAGALNIRVAFSVGIFDPLGGYELRFRPFASVYAQLLNLVIRISSGSECSIETVQTHDKLAMIFRSAVKLPEGFPAEGSDMSALFKAFPHEAANILFLEQAMRSMKYQIYYTVKADGLLELHVYIPLNDKKGLPLGVPVPELVVQSAFKRAEKRVYEYIESIFMI